MVAWSFVFAIGSAAVAGPHADHAAHPPPLPARHARPPDAPVGPPPDVWVYGYYATWAGSLSDLRWDRLTHVAVFSVDLNADGSLDQESLWNTHGPEAVSLGAAHGVRVHLTLTCFDDAVMEAVLPSPALRGRTVARLGELVDAAGAHGVSVDCEGMPAALRDDFVAFVAELDDRVDEVTVATPSVDWSDAYDRAALAEIADALFIMGYGYHWSSGDPGPVAPLVAGDPWATWSLSWSVEDHLSTGAPASRIVLGLPLYGRDWPSTDTSVPGTATARGEAVVMSNAVVQAASTGRLWDAQTSTPYTFPDSRSQLWYDDTDSLQIKIGWAVDQGLRGVGFWALNYEGGDPAFWQMVEHETTLPDSGEDSGVADDSGGGGLDDGGSDGGSGGGGGSGSGSDGAGEGDGDGGVQAGGPPGERVPLYACQAAPAAGGLAGLLALGVGLIRRREGA